MHIGVWAYMVTVMGLSLGCYAFGLWIGYMWGKGK